MAMDAQSAVHRSLEISSQMDSGLVDLSFEGNFCLSLQYYI